jgi:transcriptional regulator NrdR family protein
MFLSINVEVVYKIMQKEQIESESVVRVGKTVLTRINQITVKLVGALNDMKELKEQIEVILVRNASRPNDVKELKDLYDQMDKIKERLEKVL